MDTYQHHLVIGCFQTKKTTLYKDFKQAHSKYKGMKFVEITE